MEEDQQQSTPSDPSNPPDDPTLQKKHQAMLHRLSSRHQSRTTTTTTTTTTSAAAFLSKFTDSKRLIESQLADSSILSFDTSRLKSHLADISSDISSLEKLVAENSYFLPPYELRSCLNSISDLKQSLENLYPKKKFSFKKTKSSALTKPKISAPQTEISEPAINIRDSPGFRNKSNETLIQSFKNSKIGEFTLSDLDSCAVRLIGYVNAMFINRLRNCRVYAGPVIGSVLIEEAVDCVFVLAAHQMRMHGVERSDFYVRVRSRPIIEDCGGVRFAPYCLKYEGIEEDLMEAGLEEETGNWCNVDDFKWLRALQSPNWSVLEEDERIGSIVIENLGDGDGED